MRVCAAGRSSSTTMKPRPALATSQPIAQGVIGEGNILADLYDLAGGVVAGRRSSNDITVFKNAGGAHLDLMTAELVLTRLGVLPS